MAIKRCDQCSGRLGLGVRFRNYFYWLGFVHRRFYSSYCQTLSDEAYENAKRTQRWHSFLQGQS
jgi:hypothetical protein